MDKMNNFIKKKTFFFSIIIVLSVLQSSCDNDSIDLGSHYKYDTKHQFITSHQIGILYPFNIKQQPKRKDIPPCVIDYKYDNDFIIVKQKPKVPIEQIYYDYDEVYYPLGFDSIYYWIIDKNQGCVIGPLLYQDFYNKCEIYRIVFVWNE